jgi:protein tyrosine phosphatase
MQRYALVVSQQPDLFTMYRPHGFVVHSHRVEDPRYVVAAQKQGILEQMERLKPTILGEYKSRTVAMLIHCSGGVDRTTPITAFVASQVLLDYLT